MPTWFYNRPLDKADPTELRVAQVFDQLPEGWMIRWGYFYERKSSAGLKDREGDFILLGPDGRILVVEVKSGQNRHFVLTGEWEHGEDNPATQLFDEWKAVIDSLKDGYEGVVPYVGKALCLPHVNLIEQDRLSGELERECLIFKQDIENFTGWWSRYMGKHATYCKEPRKAFQVGLAKGLQPSAVQLFLKQSDRLFEQFKASEFDILRMLSGNRCWMVEGGVGTGKTFLALKQAEWLAEQGEGQRVLFLVFNLLLAERLKRMAARLDLRGGAVEVRSWQELLGEIIAVEGLELEVPKDKAAVDLYFQKELPAYVRMALESGQVPSKYDALVVDEAQDHDTRIDGGEESAGWWSWYFRLLKKGAEAPIALFYDAAQRPDFRGADRWVPVVRGSYSVWLR
ncbi:MAG: DEAD/DEAH box helicase family protein [Opitutales bacterium]